MDEGNRKKEEWMEEIRRSGHLSSWSVVELDPSKGIPFEGSPLRDQKEAYAQGSEALVIEPWSFRP